LRKIKKLTNQIEKLKMEIEEIKTEMLEKRKKVDKKGRSGITPAEYEEFRQKCARKIKDKERAIRRKELARQMRLKKLKEKEKKKD